VQTAADKHRGIFGVAAVGVALGGAALLHL
jgi:hypothetical protein